MFGLFSGIFSSNENTQNNNNDQVAATAPHTGGQVTLLQETFDSSNLSSSADVASSDFANKNGAAFTNASNDGAMDFAAVDMTGHTNGKITFDAGVLSGGFEQWGTHYGDMVRIELVTDSGVIVLDTFTGSGNALVGSETGQVLDYGMDQISYDLPEGLGAFTLRIASDISANSEQLAFDNISITADPVATAPVEAPEETPAETETVGGEELTLMLETFDNSNLASSSNVVGSDFANYNGTAFTSGSYDGALEFASVDMTGLTNGQITLDAGVVSGGFEAWGAAYGDMFRIELVTADGVIVLDTFSGTGDTLVGSETGQTIDCGLEQISYDIPAGLGSFSLQIVSDISYCGEQIQIDNVKITAETPVVVVEAPAALELVATDDAITVEETEGSGDIDGNVLDNDSIDGVSYTGNVDAVLNDAANVGNWVEGSNGGRIKINADGSYDFDAEGDFDQLKDGQQAETTFTYQISENGTIIPQHNILFVFDVSNSTVSTSGSDSFSGAGVGDVNGDGRADTVLDAQIVAAKAVVQDLLDRGIDPANVNIGISTFSGVDTTGSNSYNHATVDAQTLGTFSLDDGNLMSTFDSILSGSWTNYEAGLGEAENWFAANAEAGEENVMYFLSDGRPITGFDSHGNYVEQSAAEYADELAGVEAYGTAIHAIGVGANSSLDALDGIDNTGGAVQVLDAASMTAELLASHDYVAAVDSATITVTVNGMGQREANADVIVVSESETAGDLEAINGDSSSVLSNDITDSGPFNNTVATVNGSVTNVNVSVAGSNGGLATINADGTVDFDAAGDFDHLRDGQTAETTFTYTIQGGEQATIVVKVEGETEYGANADVITVTESEGFGDDDGNLLANDTEENGTYTGDVEAVNGDKDQVGEVVEGDNGGSLIVNADGSVDFSADGDFEHLNDGDVATTTFSYEIEGGDTASVTFNVQGETDFVEPPAPEVINVAILLQADSTMYAQGDNQNYINDWGDYNGDGVANQQMDMAYLAVADFMPEAFAKADLAGYELNVSLVSFDGKGANYHIATESNWQGKLQAKVSSDDSGDYGQAFENAKSFFDDVSDDDATNLLFFIGNGKQTGAWNTEYAALKDAHDVQIDAYMADLEVNIEDPNLINLVSIDDGIIVNQMFADDADDAQGFGMAQNALSIDAFLV